MTWKCLAKRSQHRQLHWLHWLHWGDGLAWHGRCRASRLWAPTVRGWVGRGSCRARRVEWVNPSDLNMWLQRLCRGVFETASGAWPYLLSGSAGASPYLSPARNSTRPSKAAIYFGTAHGGERSIRLLSCSGDRSFCACQLLLCLALGATQSSLSVNTRSLRMQQGHRLNATSTWRPASAIRANPPQTRSTSTHAPIPRACRLTTRRG